MTRLLGFKKYVKNVEVITYRLRLCPLPIVLKTMVSTLIISFVVFRAIARPLHFNKK